MREKHISQQLLPLMLCIFFLNQLSAQCSLEDKYWNVRKRLNEHFVRNDYNSLKDGYDDLDGIGVAIVDEKTGLLLMPIQYTNAGFGMPAPGYNMATNAIFPNGDATAAQGNYFAMLATEYRLLKNTGDATNAQKTLDELFLALQAVRRLDMSANQFMLEQGKIQGVPKLAQQVIDGELQFDNNGKPVMINVNNSPCIDPNKVNNNINMSGYSGFFYRNDMPWGFDITKNTASNWSDGGESSSIGGIFNNINAHNGVWVPKGASLFSGEREGAFSSIDQIYGLLYGLGMVKTMIPTPTTPEEIKVIDTVDKMMVGLIAQGMNDLKLIGCFETLGGVQGQWAFPFENKLYDIAKQFGLKDMVDAIIPDASIKSALSSFASFDDIYHNIDCLKNNSFQTNNYLRLFSISPVDNVKSPLHLSPLTELIGTVQNDLVVVGNIAAKDQKYSYGLSAALMNGDNDSNKKIDKVLNNNCEGMKAKLATAPCCGPNIGITNFPTKNLATTTKDLEWLVGDSNDEGVECPEGEYYTGLLLIPPPLLVVGALITSTDYVKFGNEPMAWNGIDYLLDYNLMLLACEQEVKSGDWHLPAKAPTLKQPDPLTNTSGCEDDKFFLHINGPEEVCAGSDATFSLSTANGNAPTFDGKWTGGGVVRKSVNDKNLTIANLTEKQKADSMQTLTTKIPTNLPNGATYTVSYGFSIWSSDGIGTKSGVTVDKSVSKTIKVVNQKPPADIILKVEEHDCTYTVTVSCATCPDGKRTIEYVKKSSAHTETITNTNACGTSTTTISIPKKSEKCNQIPKVQNDENSNINLEINFDNYTNFISTKTIRPYYRTFDCRLIDIQGRTITSKKYADSNISLDVAELDLLAGIYIFQIITNDGQVWSKKFVYTTE